MFIEKIEKEVARLEKSYPFPIAPFRIEIELNPKDIGNRKYRMSLGDHIARFSIVESSLDRAYRKMYSILKNTKCTGWEFKDKK